METFNQLPTELLDKIQYLFQMPEIDIYQTYGCGSTNFYFRIKYQWIKLDIIMMSSKQLNSRIKMLDDFIESLINDKEGYYYEDDSNEDDVNRFFEIIFDCKTIDIRNRDTDLNLDIRCKEQLIIALQKYRSMLE